MRLVTLPFVILFLLIFTIGCGERALELDLPSSEISGIPEGPSHKTVVPMTFGGDAISGIYKIGIAGTVDCDSNAGYSAPQASGTPINVDVSAIPDGEVALCFVGINSSGRNITPIRRTWIKDTGAIQYIELSESEVRLVEANTTLNYTITLSAVKAYDVKINWERVDGDGLYGVHHLITDSGTATIPQGQLTAQVQIPVLNNTAADGEKYFGLRLTSSNSTRVHVGPNYQVLVYEKDDDGGQASRIVKILSGWFDNCGLYADGSVKCWGFNDSGEQGGGSLDVYQKDIHVIAGLETGVTDISSYSRHFCALLSDQTVRCWGEGSYGQLGNNATLDSSVIVTPQGLTQVQQIAIGQQSSCALKTDGTVWCWGRNNYRQLGNNTVVASSKIPVQVVGLPGPASFIGAGYYYTCALVSGAVYCWGNGASGQLGRGTTANQQTALLVPGVSGVDSLHVGAASVCVLIDGAATCWGANWNGHLGVGDTTDRLSPVAIPGADTNVTDIMVNDVIGCIIKSGEIYCAGQTVEYGEKHLPDALGALGTVTSLTKIENFGTQNLRLQMNSPVLSCFEDVAHSLRCYESGWWTYGGILRQRDSFSPVEVKILSHDKMMKMDSSSILGCALDTENSLWCWGVGSYRSTPIRSSANGILVAELEGQVSDFAISSYENSVCALTVSGDVYCWGSNFYGQMGDGTTTYRSVPAKVSGLGTNVRKIVSGRRAFCAILDDKTAKCWGANTYGALGDNNPGVQSSLPVVFQGVANIKEMVGAYERFCALTESGNVYCSGYGGNGNGNGVTVNSAVPVQVSSLSNVTQLIRAGPSSMSVLLSTGEVKSWGYRGHNGDGTNVDRWAPVTVILPLSATSLFKGSACARLSDNSIYCWDDDDLGAITLNGNITNVVTPVPFSPPGYDVADLWTTELEYGTRCMKTIEGKFYCWGYNDHSTLGDMRFDTNKAILSNKWME